MPPLIAELLRLRRDRSAQLGAAVAGAVLYEVLVLATGAEALVASIAGAMALSIVCAVRRPVLGLVVASAAVLAIGAVGVRSIQHVVTITPYLGVLVPILIGSLDGRRRVRSFALGLAAVTAAAATAWGYAFGVAYGGRPSLALSALFVCGAPIAIAAIWRRPPLRDRVVGLLRERMTWTADAPLRMSGSRWVAVGFYLSCVVADLLTGTVASIFTAAPLAAALVWWRRRSDVALVLAAVGLLLTAVIAPLDLRFGLGEAVVVYSAVIPVFGALTGDSIRSRQLAYGLLGAAVLLAGLVSGSFGIAFAALVIGAVVACASLVWRQRRTSGTLRVRLRESERRGRVAERGVQVEQERNRIAREVHDVVAHSLAVVIAQADGARFAAETRPTSVAPALEAIADTARAALGEVRTMLHDLRTVGGEVDVPGPDDIDAVIGTVRALGVEIHEATFGVPHPVTEEAGLAMFRIAQEALTNALRHGDRAEPLTVDVDWGDQAVVLVVTNAVPATAVPATERAGHGIEGMLERAGLVGGECTAGVGSNGRFRVRATLPVLSLPEPAADDQVTDALSRIFATEPRAF